MSVYLKRRLWEEEQKKRLDSIWSKLNGPIIRGVKHIYSEDEKLQRSKPKNRLDYQRQFTKNKNNLEWKNNW